MFKQSFAAGVGFLLVIACVILCAVPTLAQQPIVVELFTSEGCSDCPPADALLTQLSHQRNSERTELILLEEHVDYWNSSGWFDRFSSSDFTDRQNRYVKQFHLATAYTPQMVVDGRFQGVGDSVSGVRPCSAKRRAIRKRQPFRCASCHPPSWRSRLTIQPMDGRKCYSPSQRTTLTTNVNGGENGGRVLTHSAVVRNLKSLGNTADGKFETTVDLPAKSDWKKPNLRAIVLVQSPARDRLLVRLRFHIRRKLPLLSGANNCVEN